MGFLSGAKNIAFGKKSGEFAPTRLRELDPGTKLAQEKARALQQRGLDISGQLLDAPAEDVVTAQTARGVKGLVSQREDARRQIRRLIAQRGLGGTSAGLSQEVGVGRAISGQISTLRASAPERLAALRRQRAGFAVGLGGQALSQPGLQRDLLIGTPSRRSGGLAGIAGAGFGAFLGSAGGPGGAAAGAQVGAGIGQSFGNF